MREYHNFGISRFVSGRIYIFGRIGHYGVVASVSVTTEQKESDENHPDGTECERNRHGGGLGIVTSTIGLSPHNGGSGPCRGIGRLVESWPWRG
jgi:hypothetical protein